MRGRGAGLAALLLCTVLAVCAGQALDRQRLRETMETAKADGCVVSQDGRVTAGQEAWLDFYETAQAGRPAAVRLVDWFSRDESGPARLYVENLCFDGDRYTISGETGNDGGPWEAQYRYLLYFPDVPAPSLSSTFESETVYVLTDDDTLTWAEIWDSWFSSRSEGRIRTREVYTEYVWRETFVNDDLM